MKFIINWLNSLFSTEDKEPIKYDNHCTLCNFTAETKEELESHFKNKHT